MKKNTQIFLNKKIKNTKIKDIIKQKIPRKGTNMEKKTHTHKRGKKCKNK
jgi:hypothetical protein